MKLKSFLIISIVLFILSVGIVSATDNITQEDLSQAVDQDTLEVVSVNGSSFSDVQKAVDTSKKGDVIEIEGYFSSLRKSIKVNKDLTIQSSSKGATLEGKKLSSIFEINANVTLKNLVIKNSGDSAILLTDGDYRKLTVINCTFYHNGGTECYNGGAIYCNAGALTIINSTFDANKASGGSAIWYYSYYDPLSAIINCSFINHPTNAVDIGGEFNIFNSYFENNGDKSSLGGAIHSNNALRIFNSRFVNNYANYGGAIYSFYDNLTLDNCTFEGNSALNDGGSICSNSVLYSDDVIFSGVNISNSKITNSKAGKNGAAIQTKFSNLFLNNVSIISSGSSSDIYIDLGEFMGTNSSYGKLERIYKHKASIISGKITATYDSRRYVKICSLFDDVDNYSMDEGCVNVKIFAGKTSKDYVLTIWDDDDAVAAFLFIRNDLSVGKHKVEITMLSKYYDAKKVTTYITVNKAKTIVKAPKVTAKYKKSKKFKITVKNKASGYKISNIKLKIKVYTGKKSKTYMLKTNKKGVATLNTKKLKKGTHKVKITSLDKNYILSKSSKIIIR